MALYIAPAHLEAIRARAETPPSLRMAPLCGARVKIKGIQSKPELNGAFARCGQFSAERGRYAVVLESEPNGAPVYLKPANLDVVESSPTRV